MECKHCKKKIDTVTSKITFKHTEWVGAGKYAGSYEYEEEIPYDSGLFCSIVYLREYLYNNTPNG